jgi:cellulose synthase/poly-beta-1,6-N-acetylglucosamine synthase-like glycosyltransferase
MDALLWALRTRDPFLIASPLLLSLAVSFVLVQSDFVALLVRYLTRIVLFGRPDAFERRAPGERPTGVVIIPSLLRNAEDLNAITTTVESCATNGYPGELAIIASVDGRTERPALYAELLAWVAGQSYPPNVRVHVGGTPTRLGKMMAVEAGVALMKELVARGEYPRFPDLYFSIDGDGTLSEDALERLAARLTTPHPLTGNLRRVVSGKICIRPDLFWNGWRKLPSSYFSIAGQIHLQVAREFCLSNVSRHNWKLTPRIGIPGALYCTWSDVILTAPRFMGFMKTLGLGQWVRWWVGMGPPSFAASTAEPCPEALTGASDDTCIAFLASMASWKRGELSFEAPRTPLHALGRLVRSYVFERSHDYEPEARVYTYTPTTIKGLWKQRVRWNSSRFECAGRFWRGFAFHWEIGFPTTTHLWLVIKHVFELTLYYVLLPYCVLGGGKGAVAYLLGYAGQTIAYTLYTLLALLLESERKRFWPVILCLPLSAAYLIAINFFGCVYGVTRDVFFFGNSTNFAPEWTLKKGRTERIAILFRVRRFVAMCVRAVLYGDVPFGSFWFGWGETPWTPSGYDGWTTGKRPRSMLARAPAVRDEPSAE